MNTQAVHRLKSKVAHISERSKSSQTPNLSFATDGNNCLDTRITEIPQTILQDVAQSPVRVNVQLFNGKILYGKLASIDYQNNLFFLHETINEGISNIAFSEVRYMTFPEADLPKNIDLDTQQGFRFIFADNETLCGSAKAIHEDYDGVHIWQSKFDSGIKHIFIPKDAIRNNYINSQIGKKLVQEKIINERQLINALNHQQSLRDKKVGEYLREAGEIDSQHINDALVKQLTAPDLVIGEILIADKLITPEQLKEALSLQANNRNKRIGEIVVDLGLATSSEVQAALAQNFGLPFLRLHKFEVKEEAITTVSYEFASKNHLVPLMNTGNRLLIATDDPTNAYAVDMIRILTGKEIEVAVATSDDISNFLLKNHPDVNRTSLEKTGQMQSAGDEKHELYTTPFQKEFHPAAKFIEGMIISAQNRGASEIHFHPGKNNAEIILRSGGKLINSNRISHGLVRAVSYRLKIMAGLKSKEFQLAQSGTAKIIVENQTINVWISCRPTEFGENIEIKVIGKNGSDRNLVDIGFSSKDLALLNNMLENRSGMVIVTGPQGSGKSTTLYSTLKEISQRGVIVKTVESNIKKKLSDIEQIEIKHGSESGFSIGIQQALQQNADVIMIDKLNDRETTHLALESANCGHLILSTLEANNTASAVVRLLEMEIEPHTVASSLQGVVCQRLVRKNCPHCLAEEEIEPDIRKKLNLSEDEVFYKGQGCERCDHSGYSGEMPVYEILPITRKQRSLLAPGVSGYDIYPQAIADGMTALLNNAIDQARSKKTSLEEIYRIRMQ